VRTTIKLDDEVFRAYKQRAASRGTTFAQEVEDALRADLHGRRATAAEEEPFEVLVFDGDGTRALVDIDDNRALQALMDDEHGRR
jgi:plasmid stability protein